MNIMYGYARLLLLVGWIVGWFWERAGLLLIMTAWNEILCSSICTRGPISEPVSIDIFFCDASACMHNLAWM